MKVMGAPAALISGIKYSFNNSIYANEFKFSSGATDGPHDPEAAILSLRIYRNNLFLTNIHFGRDLTRDLYNDVLQNIRSDLITLT
jgi:hypothetical protein